MIRIGKKNIKIAIFDLDGTLLDSCGVWKEVDKRFFFKRGLELPLTYGDEIGHLGLDQAAVYTKENFNLKESTEEIMKEWMNDVTFFYENEVELKPHAKEFLDILKKNNVIMCVATANSKECYEPALKRNGIYDYFDTIEDVKKLKNGKKDATIYLNIAKKYSVDPSEVIVFEDILLGLQNASNASFVTCAVYEKTCKDEENKKLISTLYINDYKEAINLIDMEVK